MPARAFHIAVIAATLVALLVSPSHAFFAREPNAHIDVLEGDAAAYCAGPQVAADQRALQAALLARTSSPHADPESLDPIRRLVIASCNLQNRPQASWHSILALANTTASVAYPHNDSTVGESIFRARTAEFGARRTIPVPDASSLAPAGAWTPADMLRFLLRVPPADASASATAPSPPPKRSRFLPRPSWKSATVGGPAAVSEDGDSPADAFVWLGDAVYLDKANGTMMLKTTPPHVMAQTWRQQKERAAYCAVRRALPVVGVWDDHDFGANNGDKFYWDKEPARELFLDFLDVPQAGVEAEKAAAKAAEGAKKVLSGENKAAAPHAARSNNTAAEEGAAWAGSELRREWEERRAATGVWTSTMWGPPGKRVKLILLDVRYLMDIASDDILGAEQWEWLDRELDSAFATLPSDSPASSDAAADAAEASAGAADLILIGAGIQVVSWGKPLDQIEGWRGFPRSRARLFAALETRYKAYIPSSGAVPSWATDILGNRFSSSSVSQTPAAEESAAATLAALQLPVEALPRRARAGANARTPPAVAFISGDIHLAEFSRTETLFRAPAPAQSSEPGAGSLWASPWLELTTSGMTHAWGYVGHSGRPEDSLAHTISAVTFPPVLNSALTGTDYAGVQLAPAVSAAIARAGAAAAETLFASTASAILAAAAAAAAAAPGDAGSAGTRSPRMRDGASARERVFAAAAARAVAAAAAAGTGPEGAQQRLGELVKDARAWACSEGHAAAEAVERHIKEQDIMWVSRNYATVDIDWGDKGSAAKSASTLPDGVEPLHCPALHGADKASADKHEPLLVFTVREAVTGDPVLVLPLPFSQMRPRPFATITAAGDVSLMTAAPLASPAQAQALAAAAEAVAAQTTVEATERQILPRKVPLALVLIVVAVFLLGAILTILWFGVAKPVLGLFGLCKDAPAAGDDCAAVVGGAKGKKLENMPAKKVE